jgi:hypothetical protein
MSRSVVLDAAGRISAIAYLASDDASFGAGTELVIDGGYLARRQS